MSDLKVKPGQPIAAKQWNRLVDRLPPAPPQKPGDFGPFRLVLVRTLEDIAAVSIDESDTEASVYSSGLVDVFGFVPNGDGTFSPCITTRKGIMLNPANEDISSGTELWAMYTLDGLLVATIWAC